MGIERRIFELNHNDTGLSTKLQNIDYVTPKERSKENGV